MMDREKWQQVSGIFEGALALAPPDRAAYLKEQCGNDDSLRREIELLIESHQKAIGNNFMSGHAVERAAPVLAAGESDTDEIAEQLAPGQKVGHYCVIQRIGAGGMGEVYLASDELLDRSVALKVLPAEVASDRRRLLRFKQEAKIVSTLNQPNILTIYEFSETDSLQFIATEYVEGKTLRHYLRDKDIKLLEIIDIAIQVTAALDAAHDANIVHRDIKPENIMIREKDGLIKVLDFGLAKLTEKETALGRSTDTEAATELMLKTKPGSLMGTVNYMSPEQAQCLAVDGRTDIWSTGVVLYEMVAGHPPFSGPTTSHTIVDILEKEPFSLAQVPPELDRIIRKALAKSPNERYQTAKDLLIDLKNLRRHLLVEAELERSMPPAASKVPSPDRIAQTGKVVPEPTSEVVVSPTTDPNQRPRSRGRKMLLPALIAAAVAGVCVIGFIAWTRSQTEVSSNGPVPAAAPVPAPQHELNYWMIVQKFRDSKPFQDPFRLAGEINFERDYRVRLKVISPQPGHLYILNEGPEVGEELSILFPTPTANSGSAFLASDQEVEIPEETWFRFDAQQGVEKLWLVFSQTAVPELEAVKGFVNPRDRGVIRDSDLDHGAREFIRANFIVKPAVEKNEERIRTTLRSSESTIVHLIKLEHN